MKWEEELYKGRGGRSTFKPSVTKRSHCLGLFSSSSSSVNANAHQTVMASFFFTHFCNYFHIIILVSPFSF